MIPGAGCAAASHGHLRRQEVPWGVGGKLGVNAGEKVLFVMLRKFISVTTHHKQPNADNLLVLVSFFLPGLGAKLELLGLVSQWVFQNQILKRRNQN